MRLHWLNLYFVGNNRHLEPLYQEARFKKDLTYVRFCHVLAFVAYASVGIVDWHIFPNDYSSAWILRYAFSAPIFLIGLAVSYTPFFRKSYQWQSVIYVLVTGLATLFLFYRMPPPYSYHYYVQIIICFMFGFIFIRLRYLYASLAGIILVIAFEFTAIVWVQPPEATLYIATLSMLIFLLMGIFFAYNYEAADRREFLKTQMLKEEEKNSAELNRTLEQRVRERTVALEKEIAEHRRSELDKASLERQLAQSAKMEAIGTLAGGIAHDFNNILTSVVGYAELVKMEVEENQPADEYLDQVLTAATRAKALVRQILTFSRQTEQEQRPLVLPPIVKEVIKLLRASLPSTIAIENHILDDVTIMGDHTQVHQVLMNICTNAGYAMRDGGGKLTISLEKIRIEERRIIGHQDVEPGDWVRLSVEDTGSGIPTEIMNRIFDPFFTTKKQGEGTGMGLSVVHGIIVGYGGAIDVISSPQKGTRFEIFIPAIRAIDEEKRPIHFQIRGGNERILVVDDEVTLVDLIIDTLVRYGYRAEGRTGSLEALELFHMAPDRFDLVITDLTMPNLTGDELARKLTAIRPLPIILCTGFSVNITEEKASECGIAAIVEKPVLPRQLAEKIREILDGQPKVPKRSPISKFKI